MGKFFLASKTIQGLLLALGATAYLGFTGTEAGPEVQASMADFIAQISTYVGLAWSFYGRYVTTGASLKATP